MRFLIYSYSVNIHFAITEAELTVIDEMAKHHYDSRCRSASTPGHGAFINGWKNSKREDDGSIHASLSTDDLDLLVKICENDIQFTHEPAKGKLATDLYWKFRKLLIDSGQEWTRMNSALLQMRGQR